MSKEFILRTRGGIGDVIVCTPTIRALKELHPDHKVIVYCSVEKHRDVLMHSPYIDSLRVLTPLRMLKYPYHLFAYLFKPKLVKHTALSFQYVNFYPYIFNKSVKEIIAEIFSIKLQNTNIELFLTEKEESDAREMISKYKNPVIMHIHSRSSMNHHWRPEHWEELVRQMPECTFIQVGLGDEPCVTGAVDLRGKTSLRGIFALLKFSKSFVGIDSSVAHATNAFNIPGVVLFGDTDPVHWGHDNNINLFKNVACSPCYFFLASSPCPYEHECMEQISVEDVKLALIKQLEKAPAS